MRTVKANVNFSVVLLLAVLVSIIASHGFARMYQQPREPKIAIVKVETLFAQLDQRADAERQLNEKRMELSNEFEQRRERLERARQEISQIEDRAERESRADELHYERLETERWLDVQIRLLDVEQTLLMQDLYRRVQTEASNMANSQGIDMIVLDDSKRELLTDPGADLPRSAQLEQQILRKRFLFASQTLDITDDLATRLNNRFRAGQAQRGN